MRIHHIILRLGLLLAVLTISAPLGFIRALGPSWG